MDSGLLIKIRGAVIKKGVARSEVKKRPFVSMMRRVTPFSHTRKRKRLKHNLFSYPGNGPRGNVASFHEVTHALLYVGYRGPCRRCMWRPLLSIGICWSKMQFRHARECSIGEAGWWENCPLRPSNLPYLNQISPRSAKLLSSALIALGHTSKTTCEALIKQHFPNCFHSKIS